MANSEPVVVKHVEDVQWEEAGKKGLAYLPVRRDDIGADFFGLLRFDAFVNSGVHQHRDVAMSLMLSGGLTDRDGFVPPGSMGINFNGSTHDAIAYERAYMVSRLEGPVQYLPELEHSLHVGAERTAIVVDSPEQSPDLVLALANLPLQMTGLAGVGRKMIFDYACTPHDRRCVELQLLPGTKVSTHRLNGRVDWFVLSGDVGITAKGRTNFARTNAFVMMSPQAEVSFESRYGARLVAWADGPSESLEPGQPHDLYGFGSLHTSRRAHKSSRA
ncbi:MAG: hypothetical protein QM772_16745 [Ottowia sp.]|uniref:cupin domain-containing protein n=1 Tax=Ottowia sp. TaxID=1898956 RepID=UPI0039E5170D